MSFSEVSALCC